MTCPAPFTIRALCKTSAGRLGTLNLGRAAVQTPVFMPVGTQGAIRSLPPHFLEEVGAQIILANTYHLDQRPGAALVEKLGGLHKFMAVELPILTDSGGFQVFSLKKKNVTEDGVSFSYELDGKETFLSPERSMEIQQSLGSDIAMAFDECLPPDASRATVATSIERTARWAERSLSAHTRPTQSLFGIVQGGLFPDLRKTSAGQITSLPFDGFAVGGLSVGEGPEKMNEVLAATMPHMPTHTARYLMGVGRPQDLVDGVALGIDMFDCVIPTRHARSGTLYTFQGRIRITHARYRRDAYPIDTACGCYTCRHFTRAYLHHLFEIGEILGATLATIHNLFFFGQLMGKIRGAIADGTFDSLRRDIHSLYPEKDSEPEVAEPALGDDLRDARRRMADEGRATSSRSTVPAARPTVRAPEAVQPRVAAPPARSGIAVTRPAQERPRAAAPRPSQDRPVRRDAPPAHPKGAQTGRLPKPPRAMPKGQGGKHRKRRP